MKNILATALIVLSFNLIATPTVSAETRWINDTIYVPMRSTPGNRAKIIHKGLKTGTALTLIQSENGWAEVKTSRGTAGWVPSQYLSAEVPPRIQLAKANKKIESLTTRYNDLNSSLKTTSSEFKNTQANLSDLSKENAKLNKELDEIKTVSRNAISMHAQHQKLLKEHKVLETELDVMQADNQRLRDDQSIKFFVYGAGAILLGVLLAIILPNLRRKKKFSEWA